MPRRMTASRYLTGQDPARDAWLKWTKEGGPPPHHYPVNDALEDEDLRRVLFFLELYCFFQAKTGRLLVKANQARTKKQKLWQMSAEREVDALLDRKGNRQLNPTRITMKLIGKAGEEWQPKEPYYLDGKPTVLADTVRRYLSEYLFERSHSHSTNQD